MSTIKSKEDATYVVADDDLIPLINNAGDVSKSVNPAQIFKRAFGGIVTVGSGQLVSNMAELETLLLAATYTAVKTVTSTSVSIAQDDRMLIIEGSPTELRIGDLWTPDNNVYYEIIELNDSSGDYLVTLKNNYKGTTLSADSNADNFATPIYQNIIIYPDPSYSATDIDLSSIDVAFVNFTGMGLPNIDGGLKLPKSGLIRFRDIDFGEPGACITGQDVEADGLCWVYWSECKVFTDNADIFVPVTYCAGYEIEESHLKGSVDLFATIITGYTPVIVRGGSLKTYTPLDLLLGPPGLGRIASHNSMKVYSAEVRVGIYRDDGITVNGVTSGGYLCEANQDIDVLFHGCDIVIGGSGDDPARDSNIYRGDAPNAKSRCTLYDCSVAWEFHVSFDEREIVFPTAYTTTTGTLDIHHCRLGGGTVDAGVTGFTPTLSNNIA